jgi:Fe-S-cluster containining protein
MSENLLDGLISPDDCEKCRLCCWFSRYEVWETPAIDDKLRALIEDKFPDTRFISKDGYSLFVLNPKADKPEFFDCPMLCETGCKLGDEKPFECAVWPFRIMNFGGRYVISVSSLCKPMMNRPLGEMLEKLSDGLEERMKNYVRENPLMIKNYSDGYPIIKIIDISRSKQTD